MEELPKQRGSPDQSSNDEESDRQEQVKEDAATSSTTAPKRSYECTFCKRGFTNAQALGGHMNIHRKDRPKNKQPPSSGSSVSKASDEYMNPSSMAAGISSERASRYYPVFETRRNFHMYFPQSAGPNPRQQQQHGHYHGSDHFIVPPRPQSLILNEEGLRLGANLSLQIGSNNNVENSEMRTGFSKEDHEDEEELDLELRLGHDP